jgi:hypothetical protein
LGVIGATTVTIAEEVEWVGWFGALKNGTGGLGSSEESSEESSSEESSEEEPDFGDLGVDTWQFDTPEDLEADRDPIDYFIAWQMMDNSAEARNKVVKFARITAKAGSPVLKIFAASPGDEISIDDIEDGANARATVNFPTTTEITRSERKKLQIKNLSIWTAHYSGTWDGTGMKDRLDELVLEGNVHGTQK